MESSSNSSLVNISSRSREAPGPAAGRPDAHRVPAQHRPVRKLGVAPDCGAHPCGQEVWGHPSRHLCCERRERCSAGGNRPGEGERHASAAGLHRGDPGGAAGGAAGQAGVGEAEGAGAEGAGPLCPAGRHPGRVLGVLPLGPFLRGRARGAL
ncbi:U6 snRNA-associated Sm-like protein LSm1 isoform 1-T1 [Sarcoramphus papa]